MDLEELISLGEKLALSGDALRAWIEEQSAREREELAEERDARREQAEREARARETELTLAREIAAIEERNSLLRMRLLEAQNAARARASVDAKSISFVERGPWQCSDKLNEADRSFTSVRRNTSQSDIDSEASGRQDTINGGAVALLGSSTKGTILSSSDNGGERHEEKPQGVNADSPSWVPLGALKSGPVVAECHSAKSEVALSDSSLVLPDAVTGDLGSVVNRRGNVPQNPVILGDRECYSVSDRENEPTYEVVLKESNEDSYESTRGACANNGLQCEGAGFVQAFHSCEVDESPVPSCGKRIMSPQMNVLPTCRSQQSVWACQAFARTPYRRVPCLQGHPVQHDVRAEFGIRTNRGKRFECAESPNFVLRSDLHAYPLPLLYNHLKYGTRLVWDAIT